MLSRAYSLLQIKSIDDDQRVIEGIATTPTPDRMDDVVEPKGAQFKLPIPLLWQHDAKQPIGEVFAAKVTPDGILIKARLAKIDEPGTLKNRLDEAWQSLKAGLVRGLSIGFKPVELAEIAGSFGVRFTKWLWLELSAVTVPANAEASILAIKALDASSLAASGLTSPGDSGTLPHKARKGTLMKTYQEQIRDFEADRVAKEAQRTALMDTAGAEGRTLTDEEAGQYDDLGLEIKNITAHLARLAEREAENVAKATPVTQVKSVQQASDVRGGFSYVSVKSNLPPGIEFTRALMCKMAAVMSGGAQSALEIAKQRYPDNPRIEAFIKGAVPAGTTTQAVWASPLVESTTLASEFLEFLRPMTILGKFGTDGIPSLARVPFNVKIKSQTSGGNAYWVGQGAAKPLTSVAFDSIELLHTKVATIAVITDELARFSSPSAETLVRDALVRACVERLDRDFVDPDVSAVSGVNPASITNGVTPLSSAGTSADNIRTDLQNLLEQFIIANQDPTSAVIIMPNTLALAASLMVNDLGVPEFPGLTMRGGNLKGIPVIASQYAAHESGAGNLVIMLNAAEVFLADDGQVTVDASREASLQMADNPTMNSSTATGVSVVSMFQTNSLALRAERFINWKKGRSTSVVYIDDVNWGSIGSPA